MKYILGALLLAASILIYQNATKKSAWESFAEFGQSLKISMETDVCVRAMQEALRNAQTLEESYKSSPSEENLRALYSDLKSSEESAHKLGCQKLVKKHSSEQQKERFFESYKKVRSMSDFYAEASGESFLLIKWHRFLSWL